MTFCVKYDTKSDTKKPDRVIRRALFAIKLTPYIRPVNWIKTNRPTRSI